MFIYFNFYDIFTNLEDTLYNVHCVFRGKVNIQFENQKNCKIGIDDILAFDVLTPY